MLDELRLREKHQQVERNRAILADLRRRQEEGERLAAENQRNEPVPTGLAAACWVSWAFSGGGRVVHKRIEEDNPGQADLIRQLEGG